MILQAIDRYRFPLGPSSPATGDCSLPLQRAGIRATCELDNTVSRKGCEFRSRRCDGQIETNRGLPIRPFLRAAGHRNGAEAIRRQADFPLDGGVRPIIRRVTGHACSPVADELAPDNPQRRALVEDAAQVADGMAVGDLDILRTKHVDAFTAIPNPVAAGLAVNVAHILGDLTVEASLTIAVAMAAVVLDLPAHVGGEALPVTSPRRRCGWSR